MHTIEYIYRGQIEKTSWRAGRLTIKWVDAYSRNGTQYPWMTKRDCQHEAKFEGGKAVFIRE